MGLSCPARDPLFSPEVARELAGLDPGLDALGIAERLRERLGGGLARRAAELVALRRRAAGRFPDPARLFFTARGLEQATAHPVARARAARIAAVEAGARVWDATAGIGGDALALLEAGLAVLASDLDGPTARVLGANLAPPEGLALAFRADALHPPLRPRGLDFLLLDPDRRGADLERRVGHPEGWSPPLGDALALAARFRGACVKLPPAFRVEEGLEPRDLPCSWQWVSLRGELKEVTLWIGALARPPAQPRAIRTDLPGWEGGLGWRAEREVLALDGRGGTAHLAGMPREVAPLAPEEAARVDWIAEPDPAVIRSGLLGLVAEAEGLFPLGPGLAFLGGSGPPRSPLLRGWRVLDGASLDERRVRAMLRVHDVGPLTVKKRGLPEDAASLARRLRGPGRRRGLLIVARLGRGHRAFLVEPGAR